eukprot:2073509-Rhodomonas_salina.1
MEAASGCDRRVSGGAAIQSVCSMVPERCILLFFGRCSPYICVRHFLQLFRHTLPKPGPRDVPMGKG